MAKRKTYDWEAIEREFRAGVLSIRELGRKHGCSDTAIRKRAKKEGWERDLSAKVREKVRTKLVRSKVRTPNANDAQIVEEESDRVVDTLNLLRKDIVDLGKVESKLMKELLGEPTKLYLAQYQGKVVEKVVNLTVSERCQAANNLANVQHKRIALMRQAIGMDDDSAARVLKEFISKLDPASKQGVSDAMGGDE